MRRRSLRPLQRLQIDVSLLRRDSSITAPAIARIETGSTVQWLAGEADHLLVRTEAGQLGWLESSVL